MDWGVIRIYNKIIVIELAKIKVIQNLDLIYTPRFFSSNIF